MSIFMMHTSMRDEGKDMLVQSLPDARQQKKKKKKIYIY